MNPTDPRVRLLALVLATRDDEVRSGTIPSESAHQVPPTIARAIASLLLEIGKDAVLTSDLVASIGAEIGDPAFAKRYSEFVSSLTERLRLDMPIDPLEGQTIAVQRRAKKIVGDEAAAVRRKSSSDLLTSPLQAKSPPAQMPAGGHQPLSSVPTDRRRARAPALSAPPPPHSR